jgi:hypothetical protein
MIGCGASNRDGSLCQSESTTKVGIFFACEEHAKVSRDFFSRKNRESYASGIRFQKELSANANRTSSNLG